MADIDYLRSRMKELHGTEINNSFKLFERRITQNKYFFSFLELSLLFLTFLSKDKRYILKHTWSLHAFLAFSYLSVNSYLANNFYDKYSECYSKDEEIKSQTSIIQMYRSYFLLT